MHTFRILLFILFLPLIFTAPLDRLPSRSELSAHKIDPEPSTSDARNIAMHVREADNELDILDADFDELYGRLVSERRAEAMGKIEIQDPAIMTKQENDG